MSESTTLQVGVRALRENLSAYMRQVESGASIQITSPNRVIAELRPPAAETRPWRQLGLMKGEIWMAPDFDETPEDLIDAMEGKYDEE